MQLDLATELVLAVGALGATLFSLPLVIRLPLVAALVLFVPGYALLCALMPGDGPSVAERVAIAITTSIALTIVTGLVLSLLGIDIDRYSWAYVLTGISVIAVAIAWARRVRRGITGPQPVITFTHWRQIALLVVAGLIVANVIAASRIVGSDQFGAAPAQLWLLPTGDPDVADLGFLADANGGRYRLVVSSGDTQIQEFDVTIAPRSTYKAQLSLTTAQRLLPVTARLYAADQVTAEREVTLAPLPSNAP